MKVIFQFWGMNFLLFFLGCEQDSKRFPYRDELDLHAFNEDTTLQWQPCPLSMPGEPNGKCSLNLVPLNWENKTAEQIELFVRHYPTFGESRGQVWLLEGGPGQTGQVFSSASFLDWFHASGFDMFIPTHRGTWLSTELRCSSKNFDNCGDQLFEEWGKELSQFSSYGAAQDLGHLIERTQEEGKPIFVLGGSYGTYWASRYLQYFPEQADGVVLDSVVHLDFEHGPEDMKNENMTGLRLLQHCDVTPECMRNLGQPSLTILEEIFSPSHWNACKPLKQSGWSQTQLKGALQKMVASTHARNLIPTFLARLHRCAERDENDLNFFLNNGSRKLGSGSSNSPEDFNLALHYNLRILENTSIFTTPNQLDQAAKDLFFFFYPISYIQLAQKWPLLTEPQVIDRRFETTSSILIMQGELDITTPLEQAFRSFEAYPEEQVELVLFPLAGHFTPNRTSTRWNEQCARRIIDQFMNSPGTELDLTCIDEIPDLDFLGHTRDVREAAKSIFGPDANVWN